MLIQKFLKKHGFNFLCDAYPQKLRNAIAHNNFIIAKDGTMQILRNGAYPPKNSQKHSIKWMKSCVPQ
jgi:hypothetical protein